ncbi:penicillin-binding protein 1B [Neptunicella sp.]|uniref:penicillin-binding protein 1B n=1 Tax=Neptunicella sp. TaxID=2125986 RepID=UPI003F68CCFA
MRHWWQLMLVMLTLIAGYSLYLDALIQSRFNGNKWEVPAQIYARPLSLNTELELSQAELVDELRLLAYRPVKQLQQSGDYLQQGQSISFVRRAFDFADGSQPVRFIQIVFGGGKIKRITDLQSGAELSHIRLEPWLVTRLISAAHEDRMLVNLDDVPKALVQALLLVEDRDFYSHHGVVPLSILRALVTNIKAGRNVQGGSTLTQQLVKNFFLSREKSILRKINEAWMSLLIELRYSKNVILQAYLNEVFLGQNGATGVHGFGLASRFYFDRPLSELDVAEIATLVGMVKGPSFYNPRRHPDRVVERRDMILRMMLEADLLSKAQYQQQIAKPMKLASDTRLSQSKHPAFMDEVRRELHDVLPNPELFQSGLRVFTAMDPLAQRRAESAMRQGVPVLEQRKSIKQLQGAMLVTDIKSGELRAIVGSREPDFSGFNRALDAKRSVGSVIKPAVYLTALEQYDHYTLATVLPDEPLTMKSTHGQLWQPLNADKKFRGEVNLITALSHSLNVPTVNLGMQVGLDQVADTLHRLGIEEPISEYPAMTLGAVNFSPLQVNQMYQTIANEGRYIPLHALVAVLSTDNHLIWRNQHTTEQRLDNKATYLVNYALHKVAREGTAKRLKQEFPRVNMAGKTGTTDDYRDSWFSGFDRNMVTTVWVGKDDNQTTHLTGASGALDLYVRYQHSQHPKSLIRPMPEGVNIVHFDQQSGHLLANACADSINLPAILDGLSSPEQVCGKPVQSKPKSKSFWQRLFGDK